jgi:hypothetical protein
VIYAVEATDHLPLYVGQQLDVFIDVNQQGSLDRTSGEGGRSR